jgi:hypothetical protein
MGLCNDFPFDFDCEKHPQVEEEHYTDRFSYLMPVREVGTSFDSYATVAFQIMPSRGLLCGS